MTRHPLPSVASRRVARALALGLALAFAASCTGKTGRHHDSSRRTRPPGLTDPSYDGPTALVDGAPSATRAPFLDLEVHGEGLASFQYKFGPAGSTDCARPAGYGQEQALGTLRIDQTGLADGPVAACFLGKTSDGHWQDLRHATRLEWVLDTVAPAAFTIDPLPAPDANGRVVVSWSASADLTAITYEVRIDQADAGSTCPTPERVLKTLATSQELGDGQALPGGRFVLCVVAVDAAGNATVAANSGQLSFEAPVALHLAYVVGDGPQSRRLVYASYKSAEAKWTAAAIEPVQRGARLEGRASLQIDAHGVAGLAYQAVQDALDTEPQRIVVLARTPEGPGVQQTRLQAVSPTEMIGAQLSVAYGPDATLHAAHVGRAGDEQRLLHTTQKSGAATGETEVVETSREAAFTDAAVAADAKGAVHLLYVKGGDLFYRLSTDGHWAAATKLDLHEVDCADVAAASLAIAYDATPHVAALCTVKHGDERACKLVAARRTQDAWKLAEVATVDPRGACVPFNAGRPAVAADSKGRTHVAYRYTDAEHSGQWDVAYASDASGSFQQLAAVKDWGALTGFPTLTLDASDRAFLAWTAAGALRYADGAAGFTPQALAPAGAPSGSVLEVSELTTTGGRGRSALEGR